MNKTRDQDHFTISEIAAAWQCFNCWEVGGVESRNCFLNPPCQIIFGESAIYYIHGIYIIILVGLQQSKSNPLANISHYSNTGREIEVTQLGLKIELIT